MTTQIIKDFSEMKGIPDNVFVKTFMKNRQVIFEKDSGSIISTLKGREITLLRQIRGELLDVTKDSHYNKKIRACKLNKGKESTIIGHIMTLGPYAYTASPMTDNTDNIPTDNASETTPDKDTTE